MLKLRKATRQTVRARIGLSAVSGGGKTLGALLIAKGLCGNWDKIAVIDSEAGSGELYTGQTFTDGPTGQQFTIGDYNYMGINDFHPLKYVEALRACEAAGMEVIIIDSMSHSWDWVVDTHARIQLESNGRSNSYTDWGKVKPDHQKLRNAILRSPAHVITTSRRKQEYVMSENDQGRKKVQKLGTKEVNGENWEYDLTINLELEQNHYVTATKDRSALFIDKGPFIITEKTGELIRDWCNSGAADVEELLQVTAVDINNAGSIEELNKLYLKFPSLQQNSDFLGQLSERKVSFNVK